jgi:hypothetical protein
MIRWAGRAIAAWAKPRADLIVENLCLRQQLIVLQRRVPRPRLRDGDRRFWILVCRWFPTWRDSLLVVHRTACSAGIAGDGRRSGGGGPGLERGAAASPAAGPAGLDPAHGRRESPVGPTTCPRRTSGRATSPGCGRCSSGHWRRPGRARGPGAISRRWRRPSCARPRCDGASRPRPRPRGTSEGLQLSKETRWARSAPCF